MEISEITKIPTYVLKTQGAYAHCCIAQRMSWAANRRTTRFEDEAYSLLGLFRINMPLLYGEGLRAFQRLQLEILQKYPDESVFAWQSRDRLDFGFLAKRPAHFASCSRFQHSYIPNEDGYRGRETPLRVTNWGIEMRANVKRLYPLKTDLLVGSKDEVIFWALTLTTVINGKILALPGTIVLFRKRRISYWYRRLQCYHCNHLVVDSELRKDYLIGDVQENVHLFLQFDDDVRDSF